MNDILAVFVGVFIRLIVPLLLTALVVYGLHRLDLRWQLEAKRERDLLAEGKSPCWMQEGLSIEESRFRAASGKQPCWQVHRLPNGYLEQACLDCEVFRDAPAPDVKHSQAHV
jgi:hypothetical protein